MYCLHFLGMTGGAKLISLCNTAKQPYDLASSIFPVAAESNPNIFKDKDIVQLYNFLHDRIQGLADDYAKLYPPAVVETA